KGTNRAEEALTTLRRMKDETILVEIVTSVRSYKNMILTDLSVPRDASTGDALQFTATFKEIRIVETKQRKIVTAKPSGQKKKSVGKRVATPTRPSSTLKAVKDSKIVGNVVEKGIR